MFHFLELSFTSVVGMAAGRFPIMLTVKIINTNVNPHHRNMESDTGMAPFLRVVMLPWLAHGHISPFLELAKRLSANNIAVHLCSTPVNLDSIDLDAGAFPLIHLVPLHLPADDHRLPPHLHTTKHLPSHLMPALKAAFDSAAPAFTRLLESLSPHLLIHDFVQPWAPLAAARLGIPSVLFLADSAAACTFFTHLLLRSEDDRLPFPSLRLDQHKEAEYLTNLRRVPPNGVSDGDRVIQCIDRSTFIAIRTFREIEAEYIDYFSSLMGKEILPVGPIVSTEGGGGGGGGGLEEEWLTNKEPGSVVFVSMGSEYFMREEEMEEMVRGLELSGLCYIWVVRFPGKASDGMRIRAGLSDRGLVVEGWAEQRKILAHPSVGGFVTHCGWSSVLEGMRMGVPMIALPMQFDQPTNARLAVELGVAVAAEKGGGGFTAEDLARCVREVVVGEEGEGVRRRAKEMGSLMGCKGDEEIRVLVQRITALVFAQDPNDI